ncbi:hypothetical protein AB0I55_30230 [Actinocatenispora sera]|nr:hypothetical protein [Actinocatenispora sera]
MLRLVIGWSGWGWLTIPFLAAGMALGFGVIIAFEPTLADAAGTAGIFSGCVPTWIVGRRLNRDGPDHTLYGIQMQTWAVIYLIAGLCLTALVVAELTAFT